MSTADGSSKREHQGGRPTGAHDLAAVQNALPVHLIATPRRALATCQADESLASVVARNAEAFDYFPVVNRSSDNRAEIVGLVELASIQNGSVPSGVVRDRMETLSDRNLIGADASIVAFVSQADTQPCRLVVSGSQISGLVSLYDMQKLPVRAALFAMITQLEMTMAEAIRREFSNSREWINRLNEERQRKLREEIEASKTDDTFVDDLLFTQFADKASILKASPNLKASKTVFKDQMWRIQKLRDNVAHANNYAETRDEAVRVCETVRMIDDWIGRLSLMGR